MTLVLIVLFLLSLAGGFLGILLQAGVFVLDLLVAGIAFAIAKIFKLDESSGNSENEDETVYSKDPIYSGPTNSHGPDWCSICQRSHGVGEKEEVQKNTSENRDHLVKYWCEKCQTHHFPWTECAEKKSAAPEGWCMYCGRTEGLGSPVNSRYMCIICRQR